MEKPKLLVPALGGAFTAATCAILLVWWIDSFHTELWPPGFIGQTLLPNAIPLILFLSVFFGFPSGLFIAFIASRAFEITSFIWAPPISAFTGATLGIFLIYGLALGTWSPKLVFGDLFILVAALSVAVGGAACAFLLARSCRSLRPLKSA